MWRWVLDRINKLLPTPLVRLAAVGVLMLVFIGVATRAPRWTAAAIMLFMAVSIALEVRHLWARHQSGWARSSVRSIRWVRKAFGSTPMVRTAHMTMLMLTVAGLSYGLLFESPGVFIAMVQVVSVAFVLIGLLDFWAITVALTRYVWARSVGKVALAAVWVGATWLAAMLADHLLADLTLMDPRHFAGAAKVLTGLMTPVMYVALCALVVCVMSAIYLFAFAFAAMAYQNLRMVKEVLPWREHSRKASVVYRLIHGKNRPRNVGLAWLDWGTSLLFMRPLAILMASVSILYGVTQLGSVQMHAGQQVLTSLVVGVDFHARHRCSNVGPAARVHYLEEGEVLIAMASKTGWTFQSGRCIGPFG